MSKTILVVGGAGYIGAHCARALRDRGDRVVVFDDLSSGHRAAVQGELVVGDVRDGGVLRQVFSATRFDAVLHFAAKALVGESVRSPSLYLDVNVGGTLTLARAMVEAGVPALVFSSSCSIYGTPTTTPVDESHPKAPESPYGLSKWMAEQALDQVRAAEGLGVASLRYFNAAGAHPDGSLGESHSPETHLLPLIFQAVLGKRPPLQIYGRDYPTPDGTAIRDYIHVLDLVDAHLCALDRLVDGHPGGAWNLGTGRGASVLQVIQSVERVTGRVVPTLDAPRRAGDPSAIWAQAERARVELGWTPRWTELDGIVETAWRWAQAPRY